MPAWLTNAHATLTGTAGAAEFQPFERRCVCGEVLAGERADKPQRLACPTCQRSWFVLPRDPYPRSKPRTAKPSLWKRLRPSRASIGAADADAKSSSKAAEVSRKTLAIASDKTQDVLLRPKRPPVRQRVKDRLTLVKNAAQTRAKRAARPIRLVGVGMIFALLVTGVWLWHRARIDAASATIVSVVPEAERAVADRDFPKAERLFADLVAAVDVLGANDQTALRVRQRHREAVAINNLAAQTPYDLAAEAEALAANPTEWSDRFRASYSGRWVILDVPLAPPEPPKPAAPSNDSEPLDADAPTAKVVPLDLPLVIGKHPVRFEIEAKAFDRLKSPTRAIFAAQYSSWRLRRQPEEQPTWIVRFEPGTAFLWVSGDTYAALGFDLDDPAAPPRATLERQAKAMSLTETNTESVTPDGAARRVR